MSVLPGIKSNAVTLSNALVINREGVIALALTNVTRPAIVAARLKGRPCYISVPPSTGDGNLMAADGGYFNFFYALRVDVRVLLPTRFLY